MVQRLSIALAQLQTSNAYKSFHLNEICQIIYSLCPAKEVTKKAYNNTIT